MDDAQIEHKLAKALVNNNVIEIAKLNLYIRNHNVRIDKERVMSAAFVYYQTIQHQTVRVGRFMAQPRVLHFTKDQFYQFFKKAFH